MWQVNRVAGRAKCPENGEGAAIIAEVEQNKHIHTCICAYSYVYESRSWGKGGGKQRARRTGQELEIRPQICKMNTSKEKMS